MVELRSYMCGNWVAGKGAQQTLLNPATEAPLASASSEGLDLGAALEYGRAKGGAALRALSFAERGALLKSIADAMQDARDELIGLGIANGGNTRSDAKFDVDGAIGTLLAYSEIGISLGPTKFLLDGEGRPRWLCSPACRCSRSRPPARQCWRIVSSSGSWRRSCCPRARSRSSPARRAT